MANTWPQKLHMREIGASSLQTAALPKLHHGGCLILDDRLTINSLPGGLLTHLAPTATAATTTTTVPTASNTTYHYLDLSGIQAHSLLDFGGSDEFWAGITKLYASRTGLQSVDGVSKLKNCSYLYLDHCNLSKNELLKLITELPEALNRRLISLDLSENPGWDQEVETAIFASPLFAQRVGSIYLNGHSYNSNT